MLRRIYWLLMVVTVSLLLAVPLLAAPRTHKVRKGQLLGSIAKMYGVPTAAVCRANGINCRKPFIKPGQQLLIPPKADKDGSQTAAARKRRADSDTASAPKPAPRSGRRAAAKQVWHTVRKGQLITSIAKMYAVSADAVCHANGINCAKPFIKPGQQLIIPGKGDVDGSKAREARGNATSPPSPRSGAAASRRSGGASRASSKRGQLTLRRGERSWKGYVVRRGSVTRAARRGFQRVLATRDGRVKAIHPRLIRLVSDVSNHFGGRTIEVVSGFRTRKAGKGSRHRHGRAMDFRVEGVSNKKVLAYVKRFDKVGVGYYPNSGFIHLDVRDTWTHWIDYAGPGQPARYGGFWTRKAK